MRTLEELIICLEIKTKSKNNKKVFYDKFIKNNINYDILNKYPELIHIFKNSNKINFNRISWSYISQYQKLSEPFIREFQNKLDWFNISVYQKLSESFIKEFKHYVNWSNISQSQKLSEDFIKEFKDKVNWNYISTSQKLSEDFIKEFKDKVNWSYISIYQKLSEPFIRKFKYKVNWSYISSHQKLSESFIKEFQDKLDWSNISVSQKLSESFIREFKDNVYWSYISKYQKLSEPFIKEFQNKINWYNISKYQKLSKPFIREFDLCVDDTQEITDKLLADFDVKDGYVYGFKAVRSDRYSKFNFQYLYLSGSIHESFSDKNDNENSFGLNVGTYDYAKDYANSNDIILKVRTKIKDITRVVHCKQKIRTSRLEVLN